MGPELGKRGLPPVLHHNLRQQFESQGKGRGLVFGEIRNSARKIDDIENVIVVFSFELVGTAVNRITVMVGNMFQGHPERMRHFASPGFQWDFIMIDKVN